MGCPLGVIEASFGPPWGFLWASLGHPLGILGESLRGPSGILGASLRGFFGARLWLHFGILGALWVVLGGSLERPWGIL